MDQRPHRSVGQIGCTVIDVDAHRVAGNDHQVGIESLRTDQPVLQLGNNALSQRMDPPEVINLSGAWQWHRPDHQIASSQLNVRQLGMHGAVTQAGRQPISILGNNRPPR
ncbi:hypothetical protein MSIMFB_03627 [Mycobacterium simulans]|uniref:Uncharacterized protein n=1 Tax=Mycobacterium simulans TaxID=627089 RepID=A0A7Z7NAR4_9MYCO|nr:hypothetical protein MSIMFB_03627 [Mycobacterium simulans]